MILMQKSLLCLFSSLLLATRCLSDEQVKVVTYGSAIKLQHVSTSFRLHSHTLAYGTGSGQQSVTCFSDAGDSNSLWIVKGAFNSPQPKMRSVVKCGDVIRLQHLATGKNLHSHQHRAPMNSDFEVSGYASEDSKHSIWKDGDTGDNWMLHCDRMGEGSPWERFEQVYFQHVDTQRYLVSNKKLRYGDPIPDQLQVSGGNRRSSDAYWKASEGVFYAPIE